MRRLISVPLFIPVHATAAAFRGDAAPVPTPGVVVGPFRSGSVGAFGAAAAAGCRPHRLPTRTTTATATATATPALFRPNRNRPPRPSKVMLSAKRLVRTEEEEEEEQQQGLSSAFAATVRVGSVLKRCMWAILAYMAVGVVAFSRVFETWPVVDSLYFAMVTLTTVGYGDLIPTTEAGRLFTTFYSFFGISIVGALLGYVGGAVVEAEREAVRKTRAAARAVMMEMFYDSHGHGGKKNHKRNKLRGGQNKKSDEETAAAAEAFHRSLLEARIENERRAKEGGGGGNFPGLKALKNIAGLLSRAVPPPLRRRSDGGKALLSNVFDIFASSYYIVVPFLLLAVLMGRIEGWSVVTSIYFALATATTVGYGDISPASPGMKLLACAFIPLAVISLGEILGRIAGYFIRRESNRAEREFMERRMTLDDLEAMDTDRNGEVDLFEFITFMLSSMQKVDKEMMDDLKALFEKLDASGDGFIQKDDLLLRARRKRDPWSLKEGGRFK